MTSEAMIDAVVVDKHEEAVDIVVLELAARDGGSLPPFGAGSHVDVEIKPGLIRQYSLCNAPDAWQQYTLGVLREPASRGGSAAIHQEVMVGTHLRISEPRNHFSIAAGDRHILFAGGIGVTPLLCMAERLSKSHQTFELHYCARSLERAAFRSRIASSSFSECVFYHYDDGPPSQRLDLDRAFSEWSVQRDASTHIYVCGPAGYIDAVSAHARGRGWPDTHIHVEHFSGEVLIQDGEASFQVEIASTGKIYTIPADQPVTVALADHGVDIPVSCEQGVCGSCATRILSGEPDHRDYYLSDQERREGMIFTPCCSRAKSRLLVLDL